MLIGTYQHNLDTKGRLIMPAKLRPSLGERFMLTGSSEGCILGYPMSSWKILEEKLNNVPLSHRKAQAFRRKFYSAATDVEIDRQGRINIPKSLIEHAKIDKECHVIGVSDRIEIWSSEQWESYNAEISEAFEELSDEMMDFGI